MTEQNNSTTLDKKQQVIEVLNLIEGGKTERKACEIVGINRSTFRTTALREQMGDHYARALEGLALDQIEKLEVTIEDMRSGKIDAAMARVEVDARKWFASKFLPKRFGDKLDMTTNGKDLPTPILGGLTNQNTNDDTDDRQTS